jgi:glycosyltransferase involved in cell wall biosynthesis
VLEAIQQRTPILLSDIEANRDLDLPDRFYFQPDDPAMLAERIGQVLADPQHYLVDPAMFDDWDAVVDRINDVLQLDAAAEPGLFASTR